MKITKPTKHKENTYSLLNDKTEAYPKMDRTKKFLVYFVVFVSPILTVIALSLIKIFGAEISVIKWYEFGNSLDNWDRVFGPFVRKYYFDDSFNIYRDNTFSERITVLEKLPNPPVPGPDQCSKINEGLRFDCFPRGSVTVKDCIARGCCFDNGSTPEVPVCFYPKLYRSYKFTNISTSEFGISTVLTANFKSPYPSDSTDLKIDFIFLTNEMLFINFSDPNTPNVRFPFPEEPRRPAGIPNNPLYKVDIDANSTGFRILRKKTGKAVFDTSNMGGFIYAQQLKQISASLPTKWIYGLGEQRNNFYLDTNWKKITLFTHDSLPLDNVNGYGYHPFYLSLEEGGLANGVLLWNNHALDVVLQPGPAVTFRTIGGDLGFLVVMGPSPDEVVQQYTSLIGRPFMPPYWSLGFHLSRFGHKTLNDMMVVWNRTRAAGIPFDTQWSDIDYMERWNDFTVDKIRYKGLDDFVNTLHKVGMHYVVIIDPGISAGERPGSYPPYDEGIKNNIFVLDHTGKKPFIGKVWNSNSTVFPDFTTPQVIQYWCDQFESLQKKIKFDGAWIDMNEPSNFYDGTAKGCASNSLEDPPYVPGVDGGKLRYRTVCMSAVHHTGKHYDVHNLYGSLEMIITSYAMSRIRNRRPFVISRSTSPGVGTYGGHWTGDVRSTWDDMKHSIADIMSFSMFGIPMVGADICGFNGNTTAPLCQRWFQLGAFYPFSRNHNTDDGIDQDPVALGDAVVKSTRQALKTRYSLLPYFYTVFWEAHTKGTPVIRPVFFQYPRDVNTYNISTQFMWGDTMLVAPVLEEGLFYARTYLGADIWYSLYNQERIVSKGVYYAAPAPSDTIPLFQRGGTVLTLQKPDTTTLESRKNPFYLSVALNKNGEAEGNLYWDDGDSFDYSTNGVYNYINWNVYNNTFTGTIEVWKYNCQMGLSSIAIFSLPKVSKVEMNGVAVPFSYNPVKKVLTVDFEKTPLDIRKDFSISWS